ncbi:hypothetical protein HII13_000461 [Brettanomyces bruxellensis]|nr:hypothetical protein HII13_000461 [Brettanomyces bruxellensis]
MGFKDLFSRGPSRRRHVKEADPYIYVPPDTLGRQSGGIAAYQAASSAVSSRPYTRTNSLMDSSSAAASALRKSYYGELGYKDNIPRRTMSMTSGSMRRPLLTVSNGRYSAYGNRTMSLQSSVDPYIRRRAIAGSRISSRANSLRSQSSRQSVGSTSSVNTTTTTTTTKRTIDSDGRPQTIVKKTTKLLDASGNARSIKKTTIERRGGLEIVRTTVIKPAVRALNADRYTESPLKCNQEEELAGIEEEFDEDFTKDVESPSLQSPIQFSDGTNVIPEVPEEDIYNDKISDGVKGTTQFSVGGNELTRTDMNSEPNDTSNKAKGELKSNLGSPNHDQKQHEYRKLAKPLIPSSSPIHMSPRRSILKHTSPSFESNNTNVNGVAEVHVKEPERVVVASRSPSMPDSPGDNDSLYEDAPDGHRISRKQVRIPAKYIVPDEQGKSLTSGRRQPSAEEMYAKAYKVAHGMVYKNSSSPTEHVVDRDDTLDETTRRNTMMNTGEHGSIRSGSSNSVSNGRPVSAYIPNNRGFAVYSLRELPNSRKMRKWRKKEAQLFARAGKKQQKVQKTEFDGMGIRISAPASISSATSTISENKSERKHRKKEHMFFRFGKKKHEPRNVDDSVNQELSASPRTFSDSKDVILNTDSGKDAAASKNGSDTAFSDEKSKSDLQGSRADNMDNTTSALEKQLPQGNTTETIRSDANVPGGIEIKVNDISTKPPVLGSQHDKKIQPVDMQPAGEVRVKSTSEESEQRIESEDSEKTIAGDASSLHRVKQTSNYNKASGPVNNDQKVVNGEAASPSNTSTNARIASMKPNLKQHAAGDNMQNSRKQERREKKKKKSFGRKFMRFFDL